jgi:hypothetical protein
VQVIAPPKPGTPRYQVLALVCGAPGELDAAAIAGVVWPVPALPPPEPLRWSPVAVRATLDAWRAGIQGRHLAREAERAAAVERVAVDLQRLTSIGLIEKATGRLPALSPWFLAKGGTDAEALESALSAGRSDALDEVEDEATDAGSAEMLALIAEVRLLPRPATDLVWVVGVQSQVPERTVWRAWSRLIEAGVIVPPSYRWPTEAGIALVQGPS